MRIFDRLARLWPRKRPISSSMGALSPKVVRQMAISIAQTQQHELNCDEVYELLDLFADMIARGEDAATLMPLVQHHLEMCPDCREEYETLLRSLEATRA